MFFYFYSLKIFMFYLYFPPFQWVPNFLNGFLIQVFVSIIIHCFLDLQWVFSSVFKTHLLPLSTSKFCFSPIITHLELPLEFLLSYIIRCYNFPLKLSFNYMLVMLDPLIKLPVLYDLKRCLAFLQYF